MANRGHGADSTLTLDLCGGAAGAPNEACPGFIELSGVTGEPLRTARLGDAPIFIGRDIAADVFHIDDAHVSRRHLRLTPAGSGVRVTDLGSHNGTFVDGAPVSDRSFASLPRILRIGRSLFRFTNDIRPFLDGRVEQHDSEIVGPVLRAARRAVQRAARLGDTVLLEGPSGVGKELAARLFHRAGARSGGPFVAVNCAAIPPGLAERLLFGAARGAYSGADANVEGYLQAADGGVLFLDEIGDLCADVQPKLLRVLETREVTPLGGVRPRRLTFHLCAATLKDLTGEIEAGRFRADLYYRLARPIVPLPALADRPEEIVPIVRMALASVDRQLVPDPIVLEQCALREWPGNVRELLEAAREAARAALEAGRRDVLCEDLPIDAGRSRPTAASSGRASKLSTAEIENVLKRSAGNVTQAARSLGWHRNQLRRWLAQHHIDPTRYANADDDGPNSAAGST